MYKHLTDKMINNMQESIAAFLRVQFGGMDFWTLSKQWKAKHYNDTAYMLLVDVDMGIERHRERYGALLDKIDSLPDDIQREVIAHFVEFIDKLDY